MKNKIIISGMGIVSPIGSNLESFWSHLMHENRLPDNHYNNDNLMNNTLFYHAPGWNKKCKRGRTTDMAMNATWNSLVDAKLENNLHKYNIGVCIGTGAGDAHLIEEKKRDKLNLEIEDEFAFKSSLNIASEFGIKGPNYIVSNACSASLYAISLAIQALENGWADIMLVGGAESYSRNVCAAFNRLGALDPEMCRPFDQNRKGTILGEGAAVLVLETEKNLYNRKNKSNYGTIKGYGWSCDAYHPTAPETSGTQAKEALKKCLIDARLSPDEIDGVILHGTGTKHNDLIEDKVLYDVFRNTIKKMKFTAIKSKTGHSGGASGAMSCVTAALVLKTGLMPPIGNLNILDEKMNLNIKTEINSPEQYRNIIVNTYAFGGNNMSLVIGKQ
jgi:3-oxoacyl-[acyl-carrier-protein] synthase II